VPDSLGWTTNGILVMPGLAGITLREVLRSRRLAVPAPAALDAMLDRLPDAVAGRPARRSLVASASHHGGVIASALPALREQVDDLVGELQRRPLAEHDTVPVHGDFYEAQLLVRSGRVVGLLDVDTVGAGQRIEDIANMLGHLSVLAVATDRPKPVKRYGAALLAHAERRFDRDDLRVRVAAAVVGLATGPFRVLEARWPQATARRLELARAWLDDSA
jgi:Ser/Thr protein kinase RdoA (MazF antagonist)